MEINVLSICNQLYVSKENKTLDELRKKYGIILEVDDEGGIKCVYCKCVLTLGKDETIIKQNMEIHLLGKRHKRFYITGRIVACKEKKIYEMSWGSEVIDVENLRKEGLIVKKDGTMFCFFCSCDLPRLAHDKRSTLYNVRTHVVCKRHRVNWIEMADEKDEDELEFRPDLQIEYSYNKSYSSEKIVNVLKKYRIDHIEIKLSNYKCVLCNCTIGKSENIETALSNVVQHILGRRHKAKKVNQEANVDGNTTVILPQHLPKKHIKDFRSGRLFCQLCNSIIPKSSDSIHLAGKLHKKHLKLAKREVLFSGKVQIPWSSIDKKCIHINYGFKDDAWFHKESGISLKMMNTIMKDNQGFLNLDATGQLKCKTCSCVVNGFNEDTSCGYFPHIKGKRHRKNLAKNLLKSHSNLNRTFSIVCKEFKESKPYLSHNGVGLVLCKLCCYSFRAYIASSLQTNLMLHLKCKKHVKKLQEVLNREGRMYKIEPTTSALQPPPVDDKNYVIKRKNYFFCVLCRLPISSESVKVSRHINEDLHIKNRLNFKGLSPRSLNSMSKREWRNLCKNKEVSIPTRQKETLEKIDNTKENNLNSDLKIQTISLCKQPLPEAAGKNSVYKNIQENVNSKNSAMEDLTQTDLSKAICKTPERATCEKAHQLTRKDTNVSSIVDLTQTDKLTEHAYTESSISNSLNQLIEGLKHLENTLINNSLYRPGGYTEGESVHNPDTGLYENHDSFYCTICGIIVPKSDACLNKHIHGATHVNYTSMMPCQATSSPFPILHYNYNQNPIGNRYL